MGFKPISHEDKDYEFYEQIRQTLIKQDFERTGIEPKLSLAQTVKRGMVDFNKRYRIVKEDKKNDKRSQSQN